MQQPIKRLIESVTDRPGHDWRYAMNPAKIASELGFKPLERIETGLENTLDWYPNNEGWWRDVLSGKYRESGSGF